MCELVIQTGLALPHCLCERCVCGRGECDQRPQGAAGSPPCCPRSCTPPLPTSTAPTPTLSLSRSRDLFLWASFPPFISCVIYVPGLLSPAWPAPKAHYVALHAATSVSSPGGSSPPAHPHHLFPGSPGGPAGSCPGARIAPLSLSSERTIVKGLWACWVRGATGGSSGAGE